MLDCPHVKGEGVWRKLLHDREHRTSHQRYCAEKDLGGQADEGAGHGKVKGFEPGDIRLEASRSGRPSAEH